MIAATALTLGSLRLLVWCQNWAKSELLWFFIMAVATAGMAFGELAMMKAATGEDDAKDCG